MRVLLPSLDTVGRLQGGRTQGELTVPASQSEQELLGGHDPLAFSREWTTAHPRVDPRTKELILFRSTFVSPYVRYSVLAADAQIRDTPSMVNVPIPGITCAKMMHDLGVSPTHTTILDLPLFLAPQNLLRNMSAVSYDDRSLSRFGVFPRHDPSQIRWFQSDGCCTLHTANAWDSQDAVHLPACRPTSASFVFSAAGLLRCTINTYFYIITF
ncbi:Carotenoid 9,10(9',10')-cleavage dioxygenase 1 [Beauveria bassiana]|nr:Carotenoid 9,10(9',10')-cleavage dioxygenase 1 [Beauveria bassiana]KAH8711522.1 Carotenoid 9,10(9',10')-cleavage dioxygenase 1 [Beauveria bassiana]